MPFEITDPPIPLTADHGDYDEVRGALMVGLSATKVSDTLIQMSIYQENAEDEIARRIPNAATRLGDKRVRRAAIYLTASLLCGVMVQIIRADANEAMSYQVNQIDWTQRAKDLEALASEQIAAVLAEEETPRKKRPITHFTVGEGGRGKW